MLWPEAWSVGVSEIAAKAPKLTFVHGERSEIRILDKNHAIEGVTQQELQEMKVQLIHVLDNNAETAKLIHTYNFPVVIYLTSVYWLEGLRINMSTSVATFNKLFDYLEDKVQILIPFNHVSILARRRAKATSLHIISHFSCTERIHQKFPIV